MYAVEKGGIDHRFGEWNEQMAGLDHRIHRLMRISDEHHCGIRVDGIAAAGERAACHVVLHDLDTVLVVEADSRHFIECDHIPQSNQPNRAPRHVVKEVRHCGLATRNQNAVGADFFVDVALAGPAQPQFAHVEVIFNQRDHAAQQMPLDTFGKIRRLQSG